MLTDGQAKSAGITDAECDINELTATYRKARHVGGEMLQLTEATIVACAEEQ